VKRRRFPRPEVPFIARGHPRACVDRCRSRVRSRDVSATVRPSAPFRSQFSVYRSRGARGYRALDPRPRPSPRPAVFTGRRHALLWVRLPPNDFCNFIPTHEHTHEQPILANSRSRIPQRPRTCPRSAALSKEQRPPPLEEGSRKLQAASVLSRTPFRRCKHAARYAFENHHPARAPLAGNASTRPPIAAAAVG
jgi:hypothetical protein